jgi:ketosteroid isomerase-like protein
MSVKENIEIVTTMLEAFIAGDMGRLTSVIAEDCVVVESSALPYGGEYHGKDGFAKLAVLIGESYDIVEFGMPDAILADENQAVTVNFWTIKSKKTGKQATMRTLELIQVSDGLIRRVEPIYDSALCVSLDRG